MNRCQIGPTETTIGQRPKQWRDEAAETAKQMMAVGMKTEMETTTTGHRQIWRKGQRAT